MTSTTVSARSSRQSVADFRRAFSPDPTDYPFGAWKERGTQRTPVLSCAHYFQVPAAKADCYSALETREGYRNVITPTERGK